MATITFTNNNNPNPGLEDVLDQTGDIITANATTFEIRNNNGGAFNNFIFRFTSAGSDFTFTGTTPTGGTITSVKILDATGGDEVIHPSRIPNRGLLMFLTVTAKPAALSRALNFLLGRRHILGGPVSNTYTGSNGVDHLTTFGLNGISLPRYRDAQWRRRQ